MGLFTGVGDFFRGAFGESDEEKKRRKQREAQQAQQRQQQAAKKPQQQQVQNVGDLFGAKKPNAPPTIAAPTPLQQSKPTAPPPRPAPKAPIPAPVVLPQSALPAKDVTVQSIVNANPKGQQKQVVQKTIPIKKGSAQDIKNKAIDTLATSTARVSTGWAQGVSGLVDLVTPGKGNSRVTKSLNQSAEEEDQYAKQQGIEKAYKTLNVPLEIGSYFIPTTAATKIAAKFPKGTKITADIVNKASNLIDDAGDAGKVRQALAEGLRKGSTLDQVLADNAINAKYTGEQTAHGEKVTPESVAENAALSVAGGTLPTALKRLFRGKSDLIPDEAAATATTAAIKEGGHIVEPWYKGKKQNSVEDVRTARDLGENPQFGKKDVSATEQAYREAESAKRAANNGEDIPTFARDGKEAYDKAAGDYIRKNGILTDEEYQVRLQQAKAEISKQEAQVRAGQIKITNEAELAAFKKSHQDMLDAIETHKKLSDEVVANAKANDEKVIKTGQTAVDEATAKQAAQTAPDPAKVVQDAPQTPNPEQAANDAYTPEPIKYADASTSVVDAIGQNREAKHGNFLYNNPLSKMFNKLQQGYIEKVDAGREKLSNAINEKGIKSGNRFNKGIVEAGRVGFKNFGQSDIVRNVFIKRTSQLQNSGRVAKAALDSMEKAVKAAGDPKQVYERIYRVLETPDFLERVYGDANKLSIADLTPQERVAFDQLVKVNKIRNDINLQTGIINADQHAQFADGMHSPRIYDINVEHPELKDFVASSKYIDGRAAIKRKDIKDIPDYVLSQLVDSPFQASALRLESALKNLSNHETLDNLDQLGGLLTKAPNNNFVPLVGKKYGAYEGKFIDKQLLSQIDSKDYFNSEVGQKVGDLVNTFHNSILGAPGRAYKKFRTTLSPGTIVGNIGSGQLAFSKAANINPLTSMFRTVQAGKQLNANDINPNVQEAELAGLFTGDTGRQINHSKDPGSAVRGDKDNAWDKANSFYGGIDKASALGWYNEFRARGLSPEQAVKRVHLGMQNYSNAGRGINTLADSPILGKPFARFTPELIRIMKNAAIYNPLGTGATVGGLAYGSKKLSDMSGETPEERKAREEAPGQTKIGGVSLNIPIPKNAPIFGDSSINIARAIGLNFPQEPNGDPNTAIARQLNPLADPTRTNAQGEQVIAPNQLVSDMFYRSIADQVVDRDFMGRQITDPKNKTYYEDGKASIKKFPDDLSSREKLINRARAFGQGLPGAPEIDNIASSATGNEDFYGKERTLPQAIGRMFGVKVENNDQKTRDKRTETNRFFDEDLPQVQKFVQENPDLAQKYFQIKNPTRSRPRDENDPGTKTSDLITPEKWDIINSDTSGRLFNFMKSQEERLAQRSLEDHLKDPYKHPLVKPTDPIFKLSPDQAKYVAELRSRPSGDDIEAQDILRATSDWYGAYEDQYHAYLTENSKYFKTVDTKKGANDNPRVKEYGDNSVPIEQPAIIKEYYKIKAADPEKAKEVYKANKDVLSKAFDSYAKDRLNRINALRKIEGYDPISIETYKNKTFGFNVDDSSGGFGYGHGGSKSSRVHDVNDLGNITNFTKGVNGLDSIEAQAMPQLAQFFNTLNAGAGGSKQKPKIGASSVGR